jgi:hypothetical protein
VENRGYGFFDEVGGHTGRVRYVELGASREKSLGNQRLHVTAEETRAAGE